MKKYEITYLPSFNCEMEITKEFKTGKEAWDFVSGYFCDDCKKLYDEGKSSGCAVEWDVSEVEPNRWLKQAHKLSKLVNESRIIPVKALKEPFTI